MKLVAGLAGARNRAADVQALREIIADSREAIRQVLTVEITVEKINRISMLRYCYKLALWVFMRWQYCPPENNTEPFVER